MLYSEEIGLPRTDPKRWRLNITQLGGTKWEYLSEEEARSVPQSEYVKYLLETGDFVRPPPEEKPITTPFESALKGADFLRLLQDPDTGIFPNQYKGPIFLTIGYIISHYYAKVEIHPAYRTELIRFFVNNSHPVDGGWGLHTEDKSTCFGTTITYISLRLLGMEADHPVCVKARRTLHRLGGAKQNPHWGKIWLAVLNLYKWEGVNPAPSELWALPYALPIHPGRWWVHTRGIYLPVGYVQANRVTCELDPLLEALRTEIYLPKESYDTIDFASNRNNVCGVDLYYPHTKILDIANYFLSTYEKYRPNWVRKWINKYTYNILVKEYQNTDYLTIAPVSHAFAHVATCAEEGVDSENFKKLQARADNSIFHGPEGMIVMGTNGSQVWDCAFAVQYFIVAGLAEIPKYREMIEKSYLFLVRSQFDRECEEGSFRDKRNGGWPFSTKDQGYVVSDCTAESVKAIIMVRNHPAFGHLKNAIEDQRLYDAIDLLLGLQNLGNFEYGSFSTYERIKATLHLEKLNPAEVFNNIMVEYPYVECTDSSILGLTYFYKYYPEYRKEEVETAIEAGVNYIIGSQDKDGSWYGCWGVCFTYASMFAIEALSTAELSYTNSATVQRACDFLISKQLPDGGWSESMKSCETHTYVNSEGSQPVQTAWALIGLILARYPNKELIAKGIAFLVKKQTAEGEWKFHGTEGVFNHSCAIEYPNYRYLFTIKALGLYTKHYGNEPVL